MSKDIDQLDSFEKDLILQWFLHHLPMGGAAGQPEPTKATRFEFMRQFPAIYNKLAGKEIVRVMHLSGDTPA
jgi:hypothetical protein